MKIKIIIGLLLVSALLWFQHNDGFMPADDSEMPIDVPQKVIDKQLQTEQYKELEDALAIKAELDSDIEQQIIEKKSELDSLMLEYNDNLKNSENRKLLETKIAVLMEQYNQLMLPVALDKVKRGNNPQS